MSRYMCMHGIRRHLQLRLITSHHHKLLYYILNAKFRNSNVNTGSLTAANITWKNTAVERCGAKITARYNCTRRRIISFAQNNRINVKNVCSVCRKHTHSR